MQLRIFQKGFNYSQDGPGNRLVYHLQGCNMHCPWCANPEGMARLGGEVLDTQQLFDEIMRSRSMFFEGGGVTFTGGEPTLQFDALHALCVTLQNAGIDIAIETNATHPRLPELFPLIDHLMMDFKQPFPTQHREVTGVDSDIIIWNLKAACASHPDVIIRIPMVNGYNASLEDMLGFAKLLSTFVPARVPIEPLRYHEYGREKWRKLGLPYTVQSGHVSDEQVKSFLSLLREHGLTTTHT